MMAEPLDTPDLFDDDTTSEQQKIMLDEKDNNLLEQIEKVYQLWWHWADFHLFIITPSFTVIDPPVLIPAEPLPNGHELEFVYPIHDYGYKFSVSKAEDMFKASQSMCKLFFTIEKIIFLMIERLKAGGVTTETEVQVAFGGHELAQRKGFESIINLSYNVVITNFDPGEWGERYLQIAKRLADRGYGYPPESPRSTYKQSHSVSTTGVKR